MLLPSTMLARLLLGVSVTLAGPAPPRVTPAIPPERARAMEFHEQAEKLLAQASAASAKNGADLYVQAGETWILALALPESDEHRGLRNHYFNQAYYAFEQAAALRPGERAPLAAMKRLIDDYRRSLREAYGDGGIQSLAEWKQTDGLPADVEAKLAALPPEALPEPSATAAPEETAAAAAEPAKEAPTAGSGSGQKSQDRAVWPVAGLAISGITLGASAAAMGGIWRAGVQIREESRLAAMAPDYDEDAYGSYKERRDRLDRAFLGMIVVSAASLVATAAFAVVVGKKRAGSGRARPMAGWTPGGVMLGGALRF